MRGVTKHRASGHPSSALPKRTLRVGVLDASGDRVGPTEILSASTGVKERRPLFLSKLSCRRPARPGHLRPCAAAPAIIETVRNSVRPRFRYCNASGGDAMDF